MNRRPRELRAGIVIFALAVFGLFAMRTAASRRWLIDAPAIAAERAAARAEGAAGVEMRLDLNAAGADELAALPGVGPRLAERIIADRQEKGPFKSVDELDRVRGIGPVILGGVRRYVTTQVEDEE